MISEKQIRELPKGDYKIVTTKERKKQLVRCPPEPVKTVTSDLQSLVAEYERIVEKKSILPLAIRAMVSSKVNAIKARAKSKAWFHKYVYPFDHNGTLTAKLKLWQ